MLGGVPYVARPWRARGAAVALLMIATGIAAAVVMSPRVRARFATFDDGRIPAVIMEPKGEEAKQTALLLHGLTGSKEIWFSLGERLAGAGFRVVALDLPGHGASPEPFQRIRNILKEPVLRWAEVAEGGVHLVVAHSMGAFVAAESLRQRSLQAELLVSVGSAPQPVPWVPTMWVTGEYDQIFPVEEIERRISSSTTAVVVAVPTIDHALEPYSPAVADLALSWAGAPGPGPSFGRSWIRLGGAVLACLGCFLLAASAGGGGWLTSLALTATLTATLVWASSRWYGLWPSPYRLTAYVASALALLLVIQGGVLWARRHLPGRPLVLLTLVALAATPLGIVVTVILGKPFGGLAVGLVGSLFGFGLAWGAILEHRLGPGFHTVVAVAAFMGYIMGSSLPHGT